MIRFTPVWSLGVLVTMIAIVPSGAVAEEEPADRSTFLDAKCNVCHAVPAAEIAAKTTSDSMRGPDLGGPLPEGTTFEEIAAYLRKETERSGARHKKEFKGSDDDLHSILDWLATMPAGDRATNADENSPR